jgi:tRNA modification GTPase
MAVVERAIAYGGGRGTEEVERDGLTARMCPEMPSPVAGEDTIAALATPAGRAALAVVRLSGTHALQIARKILDRPLGAPREATLVHITEADGGLVDQAIAIAYIGPRSYTGEDAVEFICHGGLVTPTRVMDLLIRTGARAAEPGEFTRRAVLNGKLDLLQAEAINDLITAESSAASSMALLQLEGGLSRRILELRGAILELEALVTYEIDFPEEDDGPIPDERISAATTELTEALEALVATIPAGELVRAGALVVISGPPNVGKSSLFNALIGRQRAIVTEIPGTTRDALEAVLDVSPFPLRIVDTAGIRETIDTVEQLGVSVTRDYAARADIVLACGDSPTALDTAYDAVRSVSNAPIIRVMTKADLRSAEPLAADGDGPGIAVSALTGTGLRTLVERIERTLQTSTAAMTPDAPILAHTRYREALERARDEVCRFRDARTLDRVPTGVAAIHLREGARLLEGLVGSIDAEEVLARVFSRFCVGK